MSRDLLNYGVRSGGAYSANSPAPVGYNMGRGLPGSYDGMRLQPPDSRWRRFPAQNPQLKNPLFVPQGSGVPLRNEEVPVNLDDTMFIFSKNIASPYCCPSSFSTSTGCVCTTKQQRDFIGLYRGSNKDWKGNPDF